jgi:glycyl-tRNA synthetase beta chain
MPPERRRGRARLVFEIGCEELPPSAAWDGSRQLRELAGPALDEARIDAGGVRVYSTPRRLVLIVEDVALHRRDLVRDVRGPAVRAAFAAGGVPTPAAEGFARSQGVDVASLERRTTPQGEYVYAVRREAGGEAAAALAALLPALAGRLSFPRAMRWGAGAIRFSRPVRWIVALLGGEVIPCEFAGVAAGRETAGHRTLHPGRPAVPSAEEYERVLRAARVMMDPDERRRRIAAGVRRAARTAGGRPILDADLLEETVQLVEWPTALAGCFDTAFLALPSEILITVMQHHQKYFAVEDDRGTLLPAFVALRNGGTRALDGVREGNEWVLRARLTDARFFFDEDRKSSLEAFLQKLEDVVFLEPLGTMGDKRRRLEKLADWLHTARSLDDVKAGQLRRAAHLSKADLVTAMVRELPELQGVMGGIYSRLGDDPEPIAVAQAISEQYLPRGTVLPKSDFGAYLALIDKIDTLVGAISVGLDPSGSQDPYGLRRASQGIVAIMLDRQIRLTVSSFVNAALDGYTADDDQKRQRVRDRVEDMLWQRLRTILLEEGISYDTVDCVNGWRYDPVDAAARARALWTFRQQSEFARLHTAFDRAARIVPWDFQGEFHANGLVHPAERSLFNKFVSTKPLVHSAVTNGQYGEALRVLSSLAGPVDEFFKDVLVMADDETVKNNRLALLKNITELVYKVADLKHIVIPEGKPVRDSQA